MKFKKIISGYLFSVFYIPFGLTTSCSCSPKWGFQTPLATGSIELHNPNNPYYVFFNENENFIRDIDDNQSPLVNLNNENIILQSNYTIDVEGNNFYSYAQPQQWSNIKNNSINNDYLGDYVDANTGWYESLSSIYSWSNNAIKHDQNKNKVAQLPVYSYRNNILSANSSLIGTISSRLSKYINYGLQYQASQLNNNDDTNLQIAWGKSFSNDKLDFGINYDNDDIKRKYIEANFAALSNAGSAKANASLRPTIVNYNFKDKYFPIVSYVNNNENGLVLSKRIKQLLYSNSSKSQWELCQDANINNVYFNSVSSSQETEVIDGKNYTYFYKIFNYENVPIVISAKQFVKSYVNPKRQNSYLLKDYYSSNYDIKKTIGDSWKKTMPKFVNESGETCIPKYKSFIYDLSQSNVTVSPKYNDIEDERLQDLHGNDFVLLVNYVLKEVVDLTIDGNKADNEDIIKAQNHNRVTIGDIGNIFPAYFMQITNDDTLFKQTKIKINVDGIDKYFNSLSIDSSKLKKIDNDFNNLFKKLGNQGLIQDLTKLNNYSKDLLKFLGFLFSSNNSCVYAKDILTAIEM